MFCAFLLEHTQSKGVIIFCIIDIILAAAELMNVTMLSSTIAVMNSCTPRTPIVQYFNNVVNGFGSFVCCREMEFGMNGKY